MMGGGPFILLKVGYGRRKTAKQAEIHVASLSTILGRLRSRERNSYKTRVMIVFGGNFRRIWIICPKLFVLLPGSQS
jgi:hypothetical protein